MLVNPGGPGGSGLIYSVLGAFVPGDVGSTYDWIGFDPRGVGDSVPALSCDPDYTAGPRPPYDPTTLRIEFAWLVKSAKYAIDCARNGGFLLGHLKTTDTVADMDAIRQSLGADKMNFYGFSYGTYLGQVYATLHPDLVRRMVLDSNVDPRTVWYQANLDQDPAFEITINKFFDWVALHDDAYHLGTTGADVSAKYYAALNSLAANPQGQLGASEWADAFLGAGYVQFLWPDTAAAFTAFVNNGDPGPATDLYLGQDTPGDDNGYAMYLATECTDARWPRNWLTWHRRQHPRRSRPHPFLTWANAWFNAPCAFWFAPSGQPVNVDGSAVPGILLLDETLDAATPFPGSLEVRQRFPNVVAHRHRWRNEPRQQPVRRSCRVWTTPLPPTSPTARCRRGSRATQPTQSASRPLIPSPPRRPRSARRRGAGQRAGANGHHLGGSASPAPPDAPVAFRPGVLRRAARQI